MSQLAHVIREKNRIEASARKKREQDMQEVKKDTAYRAKMYDDMQAVRVAFRDPNVESIVIKVPEQYMVQFMKAVYSDEMAEYNVHIDGTEATIRRKMIQV